MIEFYDCIAEYYDEIFPLNQSQIPFIKNVLPKKSTILDIGCATGNLSLALSSEEFHLESIDLDQKMIEIARGKNKGKDNPNFNTMNMFEISDLWKKTKFDGVICFGNTLAHIIDINEIYSFFSKVHALLNDKGRFFIQVVNYRRILEKKILTLPLIETGLIEFIRTYEFNDNGTINFLTTLKIKKSNDVYNNNIILYPITDDEILTGLKSAGFSKIGQYNNYSREIDPDGFQLIVEAIK